MTDFPSNEQHWYTRREGVVRGPFPAAQITRHILLGRIRMHDELRLDSGAWQPAAQCESLIPEELRLPLTAANQARLLQARMAADERAPGDRRARNPGPPPEIRERRSGIERRRPEPVEVLRFRELRYGERESDPQALPEKGTRGGPAGAQADRLNTGLRWSHVSLIVLATILVTAGLSYWLLSQYLFLKEFKPVALKAREEQVLNSKLRAIGVDVPNAAVGGALEPEPYSEAGARREVRFSERELNAMLAKNTDLARKLAIDLSDDLLSVKLLVPLEEDFPVLGGKTLRVHAGVELAYKSGRPMVVLKGVSLMGVPLPNAWLGNLKNLDLVKEFGADQGFWKNFAAGVDDMHVEEGRLMIRLKE